MTDYQIAVDKLGDLYSTLLASRQEYDFQPPALTSHAQDYVGQPAQLEHYAKQTVNARIMLALATSRMNTQALLQTFLLGVQNHIAFPMLLAARSQLELYAVVADAIRIVRQCALEQEGTFAQRVIKVDVALINATYGTRSNRLKEMMSNVPLSRLRPTSKDDFETLTSKNILTRLEKLAKSGAYPECKLDYERLCDYVHPNWGMNMLHVIPHPQNEKYLRLSIPSREPYQRALMASASTMFRAASGTLNSFENLLPPFGVLG